MFSYTSGPDGSRKSSSAPYADALWLPAVLLATGLTFGSVAKAAETMHRRTPPEPFKVANIHFETNASACDMGIQIAFDTDGITEGTVKDPKGHTIYRFESSGGMRTIGGQTEGFLEGIEPQITELMLALGCAPSGEEGVMTLQDLFKLFPAGDYTLTGTRKGAKFQDTATLTHFIPAGPEIVAPAVNSVVPDADLLVDWNAVTDAILTSNPNLGPVDIVGYHVVVVEHGAEALPQLDIDVPASETSVTVPAAYLNPGTPYELEVLSTDASGNQTISEGFFCTAGIATCAKD